jgi:hypothetical protein
MEGHRLVTRYCVHALASVAKCCYRPRSGERRYLLLLCPRSGERRDGRERFPERSYFQENPGNMLKLGKAAVSFSLRLISR